MRGKKTLGLLLFISLNHPAPEYLTFVIYFLKDPALFLTNSCPLSRVIGQ